MTFSDLLLMHKRRLRLGQKDMSKICCIGDTTYWKWEAGKAEPNEVIQLGVKAKLESISTPPKE